MAAGTSPINLPQSSNGRLLVIIVERNWCRRMMISNKYSPDRLGKCFNPMSSRISRSHLRYRLMIRSCPSNASSCRKSRTASKIERYSTLNPAWTSCRPIAWTR